MWKGKKQFAKIEEEKNTKSFENGRKYGAHTEISVWPTLIDVGRY